MWPCFLSISDYIQQIYIAVNKNKKMKEKKWDYKSHKLCSLKCKNIWIYSLKPKTGLTLHSSLRIEEKTDLNMRTLKALSIMQWRPLHQSRQNPQIPTCMLSNNLLAQMWLINRGSPALNDKPQGSTNSPWPLCLYFNEKSLKTVTTPHHLLGGIYLSSVLTLEGTPATWRFGKIFSMSSLSCYISQSGNSILQNDCSTSQSSLLLSWPERGRWACSCLRG